MRGRGFRFERERARHTDRKTNDRPFLYSGCRQVRPNEEPVTEFEGGARMLEKLKIACTLILALGWTAFAADAPGVTATEIMLGGVFPFSGPAPSIRLVARGVLRCV